MKQMSSQANVNDFESLGLCLSKIDLKGVDLQLFDDLIEETDPHCPDSAIDKYDYHNICQIDGTIMNSLDNEGGVRSHTDDQQDTVMSAAGVGDSSNSRHGDVGMDTVPPVESPFLPNFDLLNFESESDDEETEKCIENESEKFQEFSIGDLGEECSKKELDVSVRPLGVEGYGEGNNTFRKCTNVKEQITGKHDNLLTTELTSTEDSGSVTLTHSTRTTLVNADTIPRCIPKIFHSIISNLSSVGSTAPPENFSTDLVEDGVQHSRRPQVIQHNVQRGSLDDLGQFVDRDVYRAVPFTGILVSKKLTPQNIGDEWFYRQDHEYTVLEENHRSICICQDNVSMEKFVRKERKRSKFEGQKKSVLVPLSHNESPHIMDIYGLIVLMDDVYILMEYCEGGCLTHGHLRSVQETTECVQRVLEAISYIHSHGLVHGDIKPENICLRSQDDLSSLCLIDFEFVRTPETQPLFRGFTTQFLPPWWWKLKQYSNVSRAELMTMDLWAAACIAICLLTGRRPWSVQVKEFKKYCTNCSPRGCTCDLLHKLQQHISEHGKDILETHLNNDDLQKTAQGRSLWKTLTFLTRNDNISEHKAKEALNILTDEEEEKITVQIHYKKKILCETTVEPGTSVQNVLEKPDIREKLNSAVKKWVLKIPSPDHKITSDCLIRIQKEKKHFAEKIVKMLKLGR